MHNLEAIQEYLKNEKTDGWLMADFHGRNHLMIEILDLPGHITRRSFFFIPAEGDPVALVHNIDQGVFLDVEVEKIFFTPYIELEAHLKKLLSGKKRIAMEYSSNNRMPTVGLVDAGTVELVRSFGPEVVSSGDIIGYFKARLNEAQIESHRKAVELINGIKDDAFAYIGQRLKNGSPVTEAMAAEFIKKRFDGEGLVFDFGPIVAVEKNISNPHYDPLSGESSPIVTDRLVLIDLWAKFDIEYAVYGDITWMGYTGDSIPENYENEFKIVTSARDATVSFLEEHIGKREVFGFEADDACRGVIEKAGFGKYFVHRTGHSIASDVHGPGPNIDNMETEDRRKLFPGHLFSVEPGIYLGPRGYRSEIDVLITEGGPEVTSQPKQEQIIPILA